MISPAQVTLTIHEGSSRKIIIEPVLARAGNGLHSTGVFKLYKDAFGDETGLFTEPREIDEVNDDLADENNPDYLGTLRLQNGEWFYNGDLLGPEEIKQAAGYIQNHDAQTTDPILRRDAEPPAL